MRLRTLVLTLPLVAAGLALPHAALAADSATSPNVMTAGEAVRINDPVAGDLVTTGGTINVWAPVAGDVLAAGGTIELHEDVAGDIRVAGGTVRVHKKVGGEAIIAGGEVRIGEGAEVAQGMRAVGGTVELSGTVHGTTMLAGGDVVLAGEVDGDATIDAGTLTVRDGASVSGDLSYSANAQVPELGSAVRGRVTYREPSSAREDLLTRVASRFSVVDLLTVLTTVLVLLLVLPNLATAMEATLRARPLLSVAAGLAFLVALIPIVLAFFTVVGAPVAAASLGGWVLLLAFSKTLLVLLVAELALVGLRVRPALGWRIVAAAAVQFVLMTLGEIPLVSILVLCLGFVAVGTLLLGWRGVFQIVQPSPVPASDDGATPEPPAPLKGPSRPSSRSTSVRVKRTAVPPSKRKR